MSSLIGRMLPFASLLRFIRLLLLFTADDFMVIFVPNTFCGVAIGLAGSPFPSHLSSAEILARVPVVMFWVWMNLLLFNVSNQIQDASIEEDRLNKPWRPLPAQRISKTKAKKLYATLWPLVVATSTLTGGMLPTISLQLLTFAYNELRLGDTWPLRHAINAGGYISFIIGAIQAALNTQSLEFSEIAIRWLCLTGLAVASGIHGMDLYDQAGDLQRGRRTLPIVLGDGKARAILFTSVLSISLAASTIVGTSVASSFQVLVLGAVIGRRLHSQNAPCKRKDKDLFKTWCLWIIALYLMPVFGVLYERLLISSRCQMGSRPLGDFSSVPFWDRLVADSQPL